MAKKISPQKVKQAEDAAIMLMKRFWEQSQNKKMAARIITFIVLAAAIVQELFIGAQLSDSWLEITVYVLMGYFGMASYRSVFKFK